MHKKFLIDSFSLLIEVVKMISKDGFILNNLDATLVAQRPKLTPYIYSMEERLSGVLGVDAKMINIKATTTEGLGFCGREEGIAAYAVVTIKNAWCDLWKTLQFFQSENIGVSFLLMPL